MPRPTILSEPSRRIDWLRKMMSPLVGGTIPQITFNVVLLPAPLAPRSATMLSSATRRLTPERASMRPYEAETSVSWIMSATACLLRAEVGLDHAGVVLDVGRGALSDLLAEAQHGDAVGDRHDQLHDVLNQQDGDAAGFVQLRQKLVEPFYLARA